MFQKYPEFCLHQFVEFFLNLSERSEAIAEDIE